MAAQAVYRHGARWHWTWPAGHGQRATACAGRITTSAGIPPADVADADRCTAHGCRSRWHHEPEPMAPHPPPRREHDRG